MTFFRSSRLFFLIAKELAQKYTRALVLGFISGLILSLTFWRLAPFIRAQWFTPVDRIGIVGEATPATLPPVVQRDISFGLTALSGDGSVIPALASSWTATDSGKTFVFTLRSDALWHNGRPVTSSDVNYNIRGVTFTPLDSQSLRADLLAPYSPFPAVVSKPLFLTGLVGLGPYNVTSLKLHGNTIRSIRLVPQENTTLRAREYYFYKTEAEAILAFKLGEVNQLLDLSSPGDLSGWGTTSVETIPKYSRIVSLYFNTSIPMLSDRSVRQGLAYAAPVRKEFERANSPISKTSWAYSTKVKEYAYDRVAAKKLLGAAKESSASALTVSTFAPYLEDAQAIASSWTSLGVKTDVKVVSSVPPDYQVLLSAQDPAPDPDQYPFWHSTQQSTNITHYSNVKIDKLLEDGRQTLDVNKRKQIYADFQRYITEDAPAVFLYYPKSYTITRN